MTQLSFKFTHPFMPHISLNPQGPDMLMLLGAWAREVKALVPAFGEDPHDSIKIAWDHAAEELIVTFRFKDNYQFWQIPAYDLMFRELATEPPPVPQSLLGKLMVLA